MATNQVSKEKPVQTVTLPKKEMKTLVKALECTIRHYERKLNSLDAKQETFRSHDEMKAFDDEWDRYDRKIYELNDILESLEAQMKD